MNKCLSSEIPLFTGVLADSSVVRQRSGGGGRSESQGGDLLFCSFRIVRFVVVFACLWDFTKGERRSSTVSSRIVPPPDPIHPPRPFIFNTVVLEAELVVSYDELIFY